MLKTTKVRIYQEKQEQLGEFSRPLKTCQEFLLIFVHIEDEKLQFK
jgi:hypothetical protein